MYKRIYPNTIESADGYSVRVLGRVGLLYVEGNRSIRIDSEVNAPKEIALYKDSIKTWDPPYDKDAVDEDERDVIIGKIQRAFHSQGIYIQVY
jgi:hypothetical protein